MALAFVVRVREAVVGSATRGDPDAAAHFHRPRWRELRAPRSGASARQKDQAVLGRLSESPSPARQPRRWPSHIPTIAWSSRIDGRRTQTPAPSLLRPPRPLRRDPGTTSTRVQCSSSTPNVFGGRHMLISKTPCKDGNHDSCPGGSWWEYD